MIVNYYNSYALYQTRGYENINSGKQSLLSFKYQGGTDSITYKYLWSPFGDKLVTLFPKTVAPNLITLVAFMILLISHLIFMLPDTNGIIPDWKLIMMGVSIILYQHLDNVDGKQARRTGMEL